MKSLISKTLAVTGIALALGAPLSNAIAGADGVERFSAIHAGLTQDEVRSLIGAPISVMNNSREHATVWVYPFTDTWGYRSEYDVEFDTSGVVTETFAERTQG